MGFNRFIDVSDEYCTLKKRMRSLQTIRESFFLYVFIVCLSKSFSKMGSLSIVEALTGSTKTQQWKNPLFGKHLRVLAVGSFITCYNVYVM